jgi:hypothetical protein
MRGFVFYTNYNSRKARELDDTGRASLLFYWPSLVRQVAVDGLVDKIDEAESDAYFATRPIESRWSVYASTQSEVIESARRWRRATTSRARRTVTSFLALVVGRLSRHSRRVRVLAGEAQSSSRSPALPARGVRVETRQAGSVGRRFTLPSSLFSVRVRFWVLVRCSARPGGGPRTPERANSEG